MVRSISGATMLRLVPSTPKLFIFRSLVCMQLCHGRSGVKGQYIPLRVRQVLLRLKNEWSPLAGDACSLIQEARVQQRSNFIGCIQMLLLLQYVAVFNEYIGIVDIFCPKWSEMFKTYFEPWLCLAIVVNYGSLFYTLDIGIILVSKTQHVPWWVNWVDVTFKSDQSRR